MWLCPVEAPAVNVRLHDPLDDTRSEGLSTHATIAGRWPGAFLTVLATIVAGCAPGGSAVREPRSTVQPAAPATVAASAPSATGNMSASVEGAPYPGPPPGVGVEGDGAVEGGADVSTLTAALERRDVEALHSRMGSHFTIRYVPDSGSDVVGAFEAAQRLTRTLRPASAAPLMFTAPPASLLPVTDTLRGAFDPADAIDAVLFSRGWGADRRGEARLVLARGGDGRVYAAAMEYAAAGFDAAPTERLDATRPITMSTQTGLLVALDMPVAWHSYTAATEARVTSYVPWDYAVDEAPPYRRPGQTTIEFAGPYADDRSTVAERIAATNDDGVPPTEQTAAPIDVGLGEDATLVRFTFPNDAWTTLFMPTDRGVALATCFGEQPPCDAILRTVRVVAGPYHP